MLFRLQRKQPVLHCVAQSEYRSRPQHPGRTLSSAARCPASATDRLATLASQPQQGGRRAFRRVGTTEEPHDVRRQKARKIAGHSAWCRRADDRRFSSRGVKRTTVSSRVRASGGFRFFPPLLHPYAVSRRLIVR